MRVQHEGDLMVLPGRIPDVPHPPWAWLFDLFAAWPNGLDEREHCVALQTVSRNAFCEADRNFFDRLFQV